MIITLQRDGRNRPAPQQGPEETGKASMLGALLESFRDFRNRRIADPAFRRWAVGFLPTRLTARRQAKALFDLTAGFVYSQILSAAVRIDLFDMLAGGPLPLDEIARRSGLPREGASRLLRAAAALDLIDARRGGYFALGPLGAALVGNPGVTAMIRHHDILYRDLVDPLALFAGSAEPGLSAYWTYAGASRHPPRQDGGPVRSAADYSALMAASQAFVASEILDAYDISAHRLLLDVGGGDGSFLIAAARAAPKLQLALFDLPEVAAIAERRFEGEGLRDRASVTGGSFLSDPLPTGADLVTLNRVLHDHDDDAAASILRAVRKAIAPGGTLLVTEPMAGTPGAESGGDAYFGVYLLAMGQGRPRSAGELSAMIVEAGFESPRLVGTHTPLIARMLCARA